MPPSDAEQDPPGQGIAITAEALYLTNLMLLPVVAFVILMTCWWLWRKKVPPLARCHLAQTVSASLWGGLVLVVINALIILLGGYDSPGVWLFVILYFTVVHSSFILLGTLGLARAMAGKPYRYPLVGRSCPEFGL
ncbi:MAG TPA: hypothetical protein ENJ01_12075 [Gammaproteobacteria bacterium]|nr:hypothetical protein [Gammaproteobacteria bacterium]